MDDGWNDEFLNELGSIAPPQGEPWLINGDFNLIYKAEDKNNLNLNRRIIGKFRAMIDAAGCIRSSARTRNSPGATSVRT